MIQLLLATLLSVQNPSPPAPEWRDVDGILLIINEDTITKRSFIAQGQRYMANNPNIDKNRVSKMLQEEIKNNAVGSQAGESMGIDANMVKRTVRDYEKRVIDARGGVDQYAAYLAQRGQTAEELRGDLEKQVLRDMWEASRTGKGPNQQQKLIADRFVRPGVLRLTYGQVTRDPRLVSIIGGSPSKVVLQILEVDPVKVGGTAEAGKAAEAIRRRIAAGESDFEREGSFALSGSKTSPGEPLDESRLLEVDPPLAKLVANAKDGELLPPVAPQGNTPQWRVVRLVKRTPADVPGFKSPGVQKAIRERFEDLLDSRRLELARQQQFESSYIWVWPAAAGGR